MSRWSPDLSFERGGRPLSAWLRELVAEDQPTRLAAGEALQAIWFGVPSVHTNLDEIDWGSSRDIEGHGDRFKQAVRAAARGRGFPTTDFVHRLIVHRQALQDEWQWCVKQVSRRDESRGPVEVRLIRRVRAAGDEAGRVEATRRYVRWTWASIDRDSRRDAAIYAGAEAMTAAGTMAAVVFDSLDEALLVDRPGLRALLGHRVLSRDATRALARIGPPAVEFAGVLFDRLDAQDPRFYHEGAPALGSIGRDDPAVIDGLLRRLRSGPDGVRNGAASALGHAGPPLAGRLEIAIDFLLGATCKPAQVLAATAALASVGRDRAEALSRVLELAAPRAPRWRAEEAYPEFRYDEVMYERGVAIDVLHHFRPSADRVVPALVDAFDTFEEYDHDWSDHGEHGRVCWTLRELGTDAAPAVPRLVRYLDDWPARPVDDRVYPKDVLGVLAAIGPPASEALPALERLRASWAVGDEIPSIASDPDDPLDRAILAIRGDSWAGARDPT